MRCPLGNIQSQLPSSLFSSPHIVPKENKKVCLSNFSFECNNLPHLWNDFPFPLTSPNPLFLPLPSNPPAQVCTARSSQSYQNGCECYFRQLISIQKQDLNISEHQGGCWVIVTIVMTPPVGISRRALRSIPQGNTKNTTVMGCIGLNISSLFKHLCKTEYFS